MCGRCPSCSPNSPPPCPRPPPITAPGQLIASRYRVLALLGEGGMGAVYRVQDEVQGRPLALKRLGLGTEADRLRFRREFHSLANLRHPGVVQVFEYGVDEQGPFYTMELLEGRDLSEAGTLPVPTALRVLRDVAETLAFIHSRRLVHRDLTPRNIRLDGEGRARLLDFGILATLGVPGEVAGTPPYIAPETLRQQPLDQRTDLFSFGALAYWLLTGQHAFPARSLVQLEVLWGRQPAAPSVVQPQAQVPPELDALVLSLLSVEPLRRPRNAAEVVERLDGLLGERRPPPQSEVAEGYLASILLVGRQRELALLEQLLERTTGAEGRGAALLVEGEPGSGKSRMLRELGLGAQVAGLLVVHAQAEVGGRPYALLSSLVHSVFSAAPAEALEAAHGRGPVLARIPELGRLLKTLPAAPLEDPAEERLRLLSTLAEWLAALSRKRPLALLVDDAHAADEPSLALLMRLSSIASQHPLLVALACTTEARARAPETLAALRRIASRLYLHPLEQSEVEALLLSTFGEGTELKALTRWLYRSAHGSPLHTLELARHLVERGVVRYLDGMWMVGDLSRVEAPAGLADAFAVRLTRLSPRARALAEALAVHESELPLELCVAVADERDEGAVFSQLDELVRAEVLVGDGSHYRFRHAALREALVHRLPQQRLATLHRTMGRALQRLNLADSRPAETGWHLLRGGEVLAGAELLEAVGCKLFDAHDFADALAPLEAAVEAYEREGVRPRAVLEMRFRLAYCGAIAHREALQRHGPKAIEGLFHCAGLWVARRLRRYVGTTLALVLGLAVASVRWLLTPPSRRPVPPAVALVNSLLVLACTATTASTLNDLAGLERAANLAETAAIWKSRIPYSVVLYLRNMAALARAQWQALERNAEHAIHVLHTDRLTPIAPQFLRITEGAMRLMQVLPMWLHLQAPARFAQERSAIEQLQINATAGYLACFQAAFHRLRGQEQKATELDEQAEILILQLGAGWGLDVIRIRFAAMAYALTHDVLGLKRTAEGLGRLVQEGAAYEPLLGLVRGDYHRERGELEQSERALQGALARLTPEEEVLRQGVLAALAETLLAQGRHQEALAQAREAMTLGGLRQRRQAFYALRAERALALALAASGRTGEARQLLEEALQACKEMDNPLLEGALHEALVQVAMQAGALELAREHRQALERCYGATANPALLARVQLVAEPLPPPLPLVPPPPPPHAMVDTGAPTEASRTQVWGQPASPSSSPTGAPRTQVWGQPASPSSSPTGAPRTQVWGQPASPREATLVAGAGGARGRAELALALICAEAGAESGYLYLAQGARLELAAPSNGAEPPDGVALACSRLFEQARGGHSEPQQLDAAGQRWRVVPLWVEALGGRGALGVAALAEGAQPCKEIPPQLMESLTQELWRSGDATTMVLGVG